MTKYHLAILSSPEYQEGPCLLCEFRRIWRRSTMPRAILVLHLPSSDDCREHRGGWLVGLTHKLLESADFNGLANGCLLTMGPSSQPPKCLFFAEMHTMLGTRRP